MRNVSYSQRVYCQLSSNKDDIYTYNKKVVFFASDFPTPSRFKVSIYCSIYLSIFISG